MNLLTSLGLGTLLFASTDVDDLFVLFGLAGARCVDQASAGCDELGGVPQHREFSGRERRGCGG